MQRSTLNPFKAAAQKVEIVLRRSGDCLANCKFPRLRSSSSLRQGGGGAGRLLGRFQDRRTVAKANHMIRFVHIVGWGSHAAGGGDVVVSVLLPLLEYFCTCFKGSVEAVAVANVLPI